MNAQNPIEMARLAYAERIIRCTNTKPRLVQGFLSLDGEEDKALLWLAFAHAKEEEREPDHVRGLLTYLFSHVGALDEEKRAWLVAQIEEGRVQFRHLTLEVLAGTYLEWEHVFHLTGRAFNATRVRERIRRLYEELRAQDSKKRRIDKELCAQVSVAR